MEFRVYQVNGKIKYSVDMTEKELSDLKDELCEAITDSNSAVIRDREGTADAILGTLANFNVVVE